MNKTFVVRKSKRKPFQIVIVLIVGRQGEKKSRGERPQERATTTTTKTSTKTTATTTTRATSTTTTAQTIMRSNNLI